MLDAYIILKRVEEYWRKLSVVHSGASLKPDYPTIPINVLVNGQLYQVTDCYLDDKKIILRTNHE